MTEALVHITDVFIDEDNDRFSTESLPILLKENKLCLGYIYLSDDIHVLVYPSKPIERGFLTPSKTDLQFSIFDPRTFHKIVDNIVKDILGVEAKFQENYQLDQKAKVWDPQIFKDGEPLYFEENEGKEALLYINDLLADAVDFSVRDIYKAIINYL